MPPRFLVPIERDNNNVVTLPAFSCRLVLSFQGRIPETLKATSSPAPIDRQWQGNVADNVGGGGGSGSSGGVDTSNSNDDDDVWVAKAVCGVVPPSSAFANQVKIATSALLLV